MKPNKTCAIIADIKKRDGLFPLTAKRPVSLLPFNGMYRMIDFNLSNMKDANINSIFMIFNQGMTKSVIDHISGGKEWNLNNLPNRSFMHFYQEDNGDDDEHYYDAIIEYIKKSDSEFTFFMGNKMLCNIDLNKVLDVHKTHKKDITVIYKEIESHRVTTDDIVFELDSNDIVTNSSTFSPETFVNETANMYLNVAVVNSEWLVNELTKWRENDDVVRVEDVIRETLQSNKTWGYEYTGYLSNIHNIKAYYDANMSMLDSDKYLSLVEPSKKIYMKNINEVPTYHSASSEVNNSQIAAGCLIYGEVVHSILSRGTKVSEGAEISHSITMSKSLIKEDAVVQYAILDKNVLIESGIKVIGTKENPIVIKKNAHITEDMIQIGESVDERLILHSGM
ncbi:glucose-1-phosphate adenylyltransferase subunit GlgD [uncultured Vagococcus sp.]|uniref:glucose-1-phosphate adenylyltransferase subunit GlgD n=1 Tax=uncultured Vagococcus sp. TaxID=189676 RepID=UPI00258FD8EE|nr:glucose-1-phosphate adenylyltransferase subunit GlgD [uncultured Vagococcus sp.]